MTEDTMGESLRECNIAGRRDLLERIETLEAALREIAESKFCSYDIAVDQYSIGVADGHRYCAAIARDALAN